MSEAELKTRYKFIHFGLVDKQKLAGIQLTDTWLCLNNKANAILGRINWYTPWGQYCFSAYEFSVFNSSCLDDISHFMNQINERHKNKD